MKHILLSLILATITQQAMSETLLKCNTPMGSSLQEIVIVRDGEKIFRSELNFAGRRSAPVQISSRSWNKKNMRWNSPTAGFIHLYLIQNDDQSIWAFDSVAPGFTITGTCQESL